MEPVTVAAVLSEIGAVSEGVSQVALSEIGGMLGAEGAEVLSVGGDIDSVLSAMDIVPAEIGVEVRGIESVPEVEQTVPLEDSKGMVRHHLSASEAAHYEGVGLRPEEVNGRECLVRDDIDWGQWDAYGESNLDRANRGLSPLDTEGRPYELHHIQQQSDGMLAELTRTEHRGPGIDRILHDPAKTSEIDRPSFDQIRVDHWRARAAEVEL